MWQGGTRVGGLRARRERVEGASEAAALASVIEPLDRCGSNHVCAGSLGRRQRQSGVARCPRMRSSHMSARARQYNAQHEGAGPAAHQGDGERGCGCAHLCAAVSGMGRGHRTRVLGDALASVIHWLLPSLSFASPAISTRASAWRYQASSRRWWRSTWRGATGPSRWWQKSAAGYGRSR